ncbi:MAG: winged helix-turn-helix domain-containing protein [Alphaproteobacteria bacterium]|nr:winged helix-turn-helix domain-containing protein [Alphaproteobacteria bacterium]
MLFWFDEFVLDTARRELRGAAGPIAVEPQVFDLLTYLISHRDRVVSKDDILAAVWKGRLVSESALTTRINAARSAIGDTGEAQRLIKTLPRRGLRFVGTVREEPEPTAASLDRPSIAVLPFTNMSGDPAQDYFADGVVEEIITALSRLRWLSVIARNSSFTYKGRSVDVKQVGHELGARYVLEGSVRKAADRVRVTGQLIDARTGIHLWADRFDAMLEDIFELQDRMTASVVGAISPRLGKAEIDRARRKPTESLDAYDYFLRGMANVHRWTREDSDEALHNLRRAIDLDPEFAVAYGLAARCYSQRKACGWVTDRKRETAEAERLARLAAEFGRDDAMALCLAGIVLGYVVGQLDDGNALIDRALALDPNLAWAWVFGSWIKIWLGDPEIALERATRAMALSPDDPEVLFFIQTATAYCHFLAGRYADALSWAQTAIRQRPDVVISLSVAAASAALAHRPDAARDIMTRLRQLRPELRLSDLDELSSFGRADDRRRWKEAMRAAGLPG